MKEVKNSGAGAGGSAADDCRLADSALRSSELRYRRLFEAAQDGILILDAETGAIADANPFILKLLGLSLQELAGKKLWEIGAFKDVFANKEKFKGLQDSGYARYEGLPLVASDGRTLFVEFVSNVYVVDNQKVIQCNIRDNTELTQSRAELTESKTLFEMVVENVPLTIFLKESKDLRFVLFNRAGEDLLGYDRKMLLGKSDMDIFTPEQAAFFTAKDKEVLTSKAGFLDIPEEPILTAKKGTRLVHTRKVCVKGADGVTKYLLGMSDDITDRKRAETALRKSEARYRSYIDLTGQFAWVTNSAGEIEEDVPSLRKFTGQTFEEVKGAGWAKAVHPGDLARTMQAWTAAVASKTPYEVEYRMRRHDGVYRHLLVRGFPVLNEDGGVREWVGTSIDMTERIQSEAALQASVRELSALAEAMPQIVWITRADGWNIYFNKQWTTYTGLTLEESLGHGWNKPFHPEDRQRAWDAWQKAVSENGTYSIEARLRRADGVYHWWLVRGVPMLDAAGKVLKWYGTCTDIHEFKLAEQERERMQAHLLQTQKMEAVGVLAGGVAHDFNNILTAIKAYAGFIHKGLLPADPLRSDAVEILTASDRAAALTMQLLAFSRRQLLAPQLLDLNAVVAGMTKMLKRLLREDILLATKLCDTPCTIMADPGQIEQVIMNLVVNARDAMPKGGAMELETEILEGGDRLRADLQMPEGPVVCLRVRDNGHGIPEAVKEHLFEPFFTTKEPGKGTGLGLSTVFGIVKQSKGEVSFESEVGKGATFSVCLPFLKGAAVKPAASAASQLKKGYETILLVEDDDMLIRLSARVLRESGYTVITASSGKAALDAMGRRGKPVDLLLSDVIMPGMSGRDLGRELERRKMARKTLYMSGYTDDAMVKHGVLEPGIALIHKPFSVEELTARVRGVLDGPPSEAVA